MVLRLGVTPRSVPIAAAPKASIAKSGGGGRGAPDRGRESAAVGTRRWPRKIKGKGRPLGVIKQTHRWFEGVFLPLVCHVEGLFFFVFSCFVLMFRAWQPGDECPGQAPQGVWEMGVAVLLGHLRDGSAATVEAETKAELVVRE